MFKTTETGNLPWKAAENPENKEKWQKAEKKEKKKLWKARKH